MIKKIHIFQVFIFVVFLFIGCGDNDSPDPEPTPDPVSSETEKFTLLTSVSPEGAGTVSPTDGTYDKDAQIEITASASKNYEFEKWTGTTFSEINPLTLTFDQNVVLVANFKQIDTDADGVVDVDDKCSDTPSGEDVDDDGCSDSQKDDDSDGVNNKLDKCSDTPSGEDVDDDGCSDSQKDDDSDGVNNNLDRCQNTPLGETVNNDGCADSELDKDDDGDGLKNGVDKCPNTSSGEDVDDDGCSDSQKDDDGDGVNNSSDQCSSTPSGESVDGNGCSDSQKDDDGDGVNNSSDQCSSTPSGESVDGNGCSDSQKDDDGDGVNNSSDQCSSTPSGESVDENGCSDSQKDDDGDGVNNSSDQCSSTPSGESVDGNGCSDSQKDDDGDGVNNSSDQCSSTPSGESVDGNGCSSSQLSSTTISIPTDLAVNSAKIIGEGVPGNKTIVAYGHCWSATNPLPQVLSDGNNTNFGSLSVQKEFESTLTGLDAGKKYYVRSYLRDSDGFYYYSSDVQTFTTLSEVGFDSVVVAEVTTFYASVHSLGSGISDRGFLWSTDVNPPTVGNVGNGEKKGLGPQPELGGYSHEFLIPDLVVDQTIYARSYVEYSDGSISYGKVIAFTINSSWVEISSLPEIRSGAVAFSIDEAGYVGTGWDGTYGSPIGSYNPPNFSQKVFQYLPAADMWNEVQSYNLTARGSAVSFVLGDDAYVGTGLVSGNGRKSDFSKYTTSDTWASIAGLGSNKREMVSFVINGKAYVGSGSDSNPSLSDFYEYNASADVWSSIASIPAATKNAFAFSLGGFGYVGAGWLDQNNTLGSSLDDLYRYDPLLDSWMQLSDFPLSTRGSFSFVVNEKAYVGGGKDPSEVRNEFYQYDVASDTWKRLQDIPTAFEGAKTFVINGKAYVGSGLVGGTPSNKFYVFTPPIKTVFE